MDEKYLEQASDIAESQREATLKDLQAQLTQAGQADCNTCGLVIPKARRQALPSAYRCVSCQSDFEILKKGRFV
ncbi:MAG: TraR/DksA C4-type zinc finger protein [Pseudomonadota bacterium]